jgi:phosphonate transport system permease protein
MSARVKTGPDFYKQFLVWRRGEYVLILAVVIFFGIGAGFLTKTDPIKALTSIPKSLVWMFSNILPDKQAIGRIPSIAHKLGDTIISSLAATVLGSVFALLAALAGSRTTAVNPVSAAVFRGIASLFRNIPVAAWAMIFLFSFGQSTLTGFLALFLVSFGFLTRVFIESIDETSGSSVEALRATGATRLQVIFQAVLPESLPQLISWVLFCLETNIRTATMVGMLTGTGIGFSFTLYYRNMQYPSAWLVALGIVLVVLVIESISNKVRKVLL